MPISEDGACAANMTPAVNIDLRLSACGSLSAYGTSSRIHDSVHRIL